MRAGINEPIVKLLKYAHSIGGWVKQAEARKGAGVKAAQASTAFRRLERGNLGTLKADVEYQVTERITCKRKGSKAKFIKVDKLVLPEDPELTARKLVENEPHITLIELVKRSGCKVKRAPVIRREVLNIPKIKRKVREESVVSDTEKKEYNEAKLLRAIWPVKKS